MTPIGASTWIWVSPLTDGELAALAPRLRAWGFDVIELPVEQPGDWDPGRAADLLGRLGLAATVCAVMTPDRDLTTTDREMLAATQAYLRACVDIAAAVGSRVVAGPMYAPTGRTGLLRPSARAAVVGRLVEALRPLAEHAGGRGVQLALEPLNRYETSLVNTAEQALEVVERVGSPACGVALDTFHMNIEERDPAEALRTVADRLAHLQACANDRGAPGADHLDWPGLAAALRDVGYRGAVCIESFTAANRAIATAASVWRPLARSQDAIAVDGLAFLRALLADPARP